MVKIGDDVAASQTEYSDRYTELMEFVNAEVGDRYPRDVVRGVSRFISDDIKSDRGLSEAAETFFEPEQLRDLILLKGTDRDIEDRMRVKITGHYFDIASQSEAITNLVRPDPQETYDLEGEQDPSNQLKYSPVNGVLHKYELALIFVVETCSAHCRYCYRSDTVSRKSIGEYQPYDVEIRGIGDNEDEISITVKSSNEMMDNLSSNVLLAINAFVSDQQLATIRENNELLTGNERLQEFAIEPQTLRATVLSDSILSRAVRDIEEVIAADDASPAMIEALEKVRDTFLEIRELGTEDNLDTWTMRNLRTFKEREVERAIDAIPEGNTKVDKRKEGIKQTQDNHEYDYAEIMGILRRELDIGLKGVYNAVEAERKAAEGTVVSLAQLAADPASEGRKKERAMGADVVQYIVEHNAAVEANGGSHPETGRPVLEEVLLSGGDPMTLSNRRLAGWLGELAESGVNTIRIGTKELAFYPQRFDEEFFKMLDKFHETYPDVKISISSHFTHPDEFLAKDDKGDYIPVEGKTKGIYKWIPDTEKSVRALTSRGDWLTIHNQTPVIKDVNDNPEALRELQKQLFHKGVQGHYVFHGRKIEGHKAFTIPVEEGLRIFTESQQGLSGHKRHAVFAMSTEQGKVEIVGESGPSKDHPDGIIMFRVYRGPGDAESLSSLVIAEKDPEALWISDYVEKGKIIHDPDQVFTKKSQQTEIPRHQLREVVNGAEPAMVGDEQITFTLGRQQLLFPTMIDGPGIKQ